MAIVNMTQAKVDKYENNEKAWEYEDSLAAPSNGNTVLVPAGINGISVTLDITAGSGKIQTTTDLLATVKTGTPVWIDWPLGVVAADTQDWVRPVAAIRQVNAAGTTKMKLRAQ